MIFKEWIISELNELSKVSSELTLLCEPNLFLIFEGNLGVGKTTLVKFIAKKLGIRENVSSPTFNLLQRHQIKENFFLNHFDFFRLEKNEDLSFFDDLADENLNIIEWGEKNPSFWKFREKVIVVKIVKDKVSEKRTISSSVKGLKPTDRFFSSE
jgi:tRNA threonylcarbamoyladenosine biosynthesis protein TsaE